MERSMSLGRPHVWPMPIHSFRPGDHACGGTCGSNSFGISWKRWPNAEFLWHIRQSCAGSNAIRNSKSGGSASRARLGGPESYVKIKGRRTYLYRAVERAKRDVAAAKAFFRRALSRQGRLPHKITLDGYQASHRAVTMSVPGASKARSGPQNT
jgi:hypothetical protein